MTKRKKPNMLYIPVKDYGDPWINRLAAVITIIEKMGAPDERDAALTFIIGKYQERVQR